MKRHASLYRFLVFGVLLGVLPAVVAAMTVHWYFQRRLLIAQFDEALLERASTLATLVHVDGEELRLEFADEFMPQYSRAERPSFFQIRGMDGWNVERSYSLHGEDLPLVHGPLEAPRAFDARLADGRSVRCLGVEFPVRLSTDRRGPSTPRVLVSVASDSTDLDAALARGHREIAITGLVALAGITVLVLAALRRGVTLLRRLESEVAGLRPDSLGRSIDVRRVPDELRPIVRALNESRERIHGFVERERRFTADVAHELRTPIAELRTVAEVARRWPDPELREELSASALSIAKQMGVLVEGLLELAVLESGEHDEQAERFDLAELLDDVVEQARSRAPQPCEIVRDAPGPIDVTARRALWEIALRNLVDNACSHSIPGSTIRIRMRPDRDGAVVSVANPAEPMDGEEMARCRERLWRKDRRVNGVEHFGLGLSIVEAACTRLGHRLELGYENGVFHATVARAAAAPPAHAFHPDPDSARRRS